MWLKNLQIRQRGIQVNNKLKSKYNKGSRKCLELKYVQELNKADEI